MPIDFRFDPKRIFPELQAELQIAVIDATEGVRNEVLRLIRKPGTGRVYRRRGVVHRASAPGQPPATDTGFLARSVSTKYDIPNLTGSVVIGAKYGPFLEYGTSKMAERPFARVALANSRVRIQGILNRAVRDATR